VNVRNFNHNDITAALFYNEYPIITDKPFRSFAGVFRDISVTFRLQDLTLKKDKELDEILIPSIQTIDSFPVTSFDILSLVYPLFHAILQSYINYSEKWLDYITGEMREYSKADITSQMNWSAYKFGGANTIFTTTPLSLIQRLWVYAHSNLDVEFYVKLGNEFKESLLPWLNNQLWQEMEKRKGARQNVLYEENRRKMQMGEKLDDVEVKVDEMVELEDLDEIL